MLLLLAAPPGLEPRKPASETGVLPIRLKGNIKLKGIKQTTFTALSALNPSPGGFSPLYSVKFLLAGDKGVEPLQTRSQSPARYHYANPQYKQDT